MAGLCRREIPQRVKQAMAQACIEERQHDLIEHLSGRYKRRANIAAAQLTRPRSCFSMSLLSGWMWRLSCPSPNSKEFAG
jgi:ABC-type multidrug transport system ATPase subunit